MTPIELRMLLVLCAACLACATPSGSKPAASGPAAEGDSISIAVVPFGLASGSPPPPYDVAEIIRGDLESVGRYAIVPIADLPDQPTRLSEVEFETWRGGAADYLVVGLVAGVHDGGHEVEFRLIDPDEETTLVGYLMPSAPDALPETARDIADLIMTRIGASPPVARAESRPGATPTGRPGLATDPG